MYGFQDNIWNFKTVIFQFIAALKNSPVVMKALLVRFHGSGCVRSFWSTVMTDVAWSHVTRCPHFMGGSRG